MDQFDQAVRIEIDIRQSRENGFNCEGVNFRIGCAKLGGPMRIHRNALDHMYQEVLKSRSRFIFAANTESLADFTF